MSLFERDYRKAHWFGSKVLLPQSKSDTEFSKTISGYTTNTLLRFLLRVIKFDNIECIIRHYTITSKYYESLKYNPVDTAVH